MSIFADIRNFIEGNTNLFLGKYLPSYISENTVEMAKDRMEICMSCSSLKKQNNYYICGRCGCRFPGLAWAGNKKCPLGKWKK